jgi:branched-chain amino acid transport system substrate-binding protein
MLSPASSATTRVRSAEEVYTKLGQLDYAAELAQIRSLKPDALFFFLPGGMGINFVKQFVAAGLSRHAALRAGLLGR